MKKRILVNLFLILSFLLLFCCPVRGDTDNTFVGGDPDSVAQELESVTDDIISKSDISPYSMLTEDEIEYSHTKRLYIVSTSDLFKEKSITADTLKEIIENSEYVYFMKLYREKETFDLIISKGREPDPELVEQGLFSDEELAYFENQVGKWKVSGYGVSDYPLDPSRDWYGLMESYLKQKGIHDAEIYFIDRINDESSHYAVVFTGEKAENGEDEIIFVGLDMLDYDRSGNLIYQWFQESSPDFTKAEYTFEELWEKNEKMKRETALEGRTIIPGIIVVIVGVILIAGALFLLIRKRRPS